MATQNVCKYNKFGYCRYRETCRNLHIDEICENKTCDITTCRQRHPRECRYYREYFRCKFDPCITKMEDEINDLRRKDESEERNSLKKKNILQRLVDLENKNNEKDKTITFLTLTSN